jgi:hypothetical protein
MQQVGGIILVFRINKIFQFIKVLSKNNQKMTSSKVVKYLKREIISKEDK